MADLLDGQFDLDGLVFGDGTVLAVTAFDPGSPDERDEDSEAPTADGVLVGRDRLGAQTFTWEITTIRDDGAGAIESSRAFAAAWRKGKALLPGEVMPLRYRMQGGSTCQVFGRPRRYAGPNGDVIMRQGAGRITADFLLTDPLIYDDTQASLQLSLVTDPGTGVALPATFPFTFGQSVGLRQGVTNVAGDAATPFTVEVTGPISGKASSPYVAGPGWRVDLPGLDVAYDQRLVIDTRAHTVTRNGASVAGFLSRDSSLSARLMPGSQELVFGCTDPTNTARAVVTWRPAYYSI